MSMTIIDTPFAAEPICFTDPAELNLCVYRGDTGHLRIQVLIAGVPADVSAATFDADIRASADSTVLLATLLAVPVAGQPSMVDLTLTAAESAKLSTSGVWDLQMTLGGEVTTLVAGTVTVTKDVSRST
jgi:hypothetical protein